MSWGRDGVRDGTRLGLACEFKAKARSKGSPVGSNPEIATKPEENSTGPSGPSAAVAVRENACNEMQGDVEHE